MKRTALVAATEAWGERNLGTDDAEKVLKHLALEERLSAPQIAETLSTRRRKFSAESVRRSLRKVGVNRRKPSLAEAARRLGYASLREFFLDPSIARKSHAEIAEMTGHTAQTVWSRWNEVRNEVRKECFSEGA